MNIVTLLVLDHNGFHHQLRLNGEGGAFRLAFCLVAADLLCARECAREKKREGERPNGRSRMVQNLSRMVVCRVRMEFAAAGRPNCCALVRLASLQTLFQVVKSG